MGNNDRRFFPAALSTCRQNSERGRGRALGLGALPVPGRGRGRGRGRGGGAAGTPSSPPGRAARPTHLRGRQPRPHLPHHEGLQTAARGAEEAGARCRPRACISRYRRHGGSGAAPRLGVTWPRARVARSRARGGGAQGPEGGRGRRRAPAGRTERVGYPGRGPCGSLWLTAGNLLD